LRAELVAKEDRNPVARFHPISLMVKRNRAAPAFRQKLSQVDANTVLLHETTQRRTPLLSTVAPATAKGIPRIDQQLSIGGNYTSSPSLRLKAPSS
jgi:hypothetical protein